MRKSVGLGGIVGVAVEHKYDWRMSGQIGGLV
jgi:hypothetical protein